MFVDSMSSPRPRWNLRAVAWTLLGFVALVCVHAGAFQLIMARERRSYSWTSGVYWTLSTMTTLGLGDITFESDIGRAFSVVVLLSGALYIIVLLPFTLISFVFVPWLDRREAARVPRKVAHDVSRHVVVTRLDSVSQALIARANRARVGHVVVVDSVPEALALRGEGYQVLVGPLDAPRTYRQAGVERAALVATTHSDTTNTNIAFTVRELSTTVPIAATADSAASVDILQLAGCDQVIELGKMLGEAMARRVLGTSGRAHVVGEFAGVQIAEASAAGTALVGRTLRDVDIGRECGLAVLAILESSRVRPARPGSTITDTSVLVLGGSRECISAYDDTLAHPKPAEGSVLVLGGGRVGRAASHVLAHDGVPHVVVEREPGRADSCGRVVTGDAADLEVLRAAGITDASAVIVTTHEDDLNVYLSLYCRRLRPDVQIISRAVHERNVETLRRAGADNVLSYAALGATAVWNMLGISPRVVLAEGVELFTVPFPRGLAAQDVFDPAVPSVTGCHVVGILDRANSTIAAAGDVRAMEAPELVVAGSRHDERRFRKKFPAGN